jgi:hypothetical protein
MRFVITLLLAPSMRRCGIREQTEQLQTKQRSMTRVHVQLHSENVPDRLRSLHRECRRK